MKRERKEAVFGVVIVLVVVLVLALIIVLLNIEKEPVSHDVVAVPVYIADELIVIMIVLRLGCSFITPSPDEGS